MRKGVAPCCLFVLGTLWAGETGAAVGVSAGCKAGLNLGGFVGIEVLKWLELQPELAFTLRGMRIKDRQTVYGHTAELVQVVNVTYIECAVPVKFVASGYGGKTCFYFGPELSVRTGVGGFMSITIDGDSDRESFPATAVSDINDMMARAELGLLGGMMFHIGTGRTKFVLDFRYTHGLTNIYSNTDAAIRRAEMEGRGDVADQLRQIGVPAHKNMTFSVDVGFVVELTKPESFGEGLPGRQW